jgi:hypothetical protein
VIRSVSACYLSNAGLEEPSHPVRKLSDVAP